MSTRRVLSGPVVNDSEVSGPEGGTVQTGDESLEVAERARPDLEMSAHPGFQRREWHVERAAWVVAALVLLATLLGVFGNGPLSSTSARSPSRDIRVDYQHFVRHLGQDSLTVTVAPKAVRNGVATIVLDADVASALQITSVTPQPQSWRSVGGGVLLQVAAAPGVPVEVQIQYDPAHAGVQTGQISTSPGSAGAPIWQLVYP